MSRLPPDDPFNRALTDRVHPADWVKPVPRGKYDLVVIGAGLFGCAHRFGSCRLRSAGGGMGQHAIEHLHDHALLRLGQQKWPRLFEQLSPIYKWALG